MERARRKKREYQKNVREEEKEDKLTSGYLAQLREVSGLTLTSGQVSEAITKSQKSYTFVFPTPQELWEDIKDIMQQYRKVIDVWDILVDVARTLTQSEYKNEFRMRGMFVLRSFLYDKIEPSLLRGTTDIDFDFKENVSSIDTQIKLDMNIRPWREEQEYIIPEITFEANTFYSMLCDKISVLTQPRLQRRIKDLYDVF